MSKLRSDAERELLDLLEEALDQPQSERKAWLERKLIERDLIGRKLEDLISLAERKNISL